jgi:CheY-like chemotaxis protein
MNIGPNNPSGGSGGGKGRRRRGRRGGPGGPGARPGAGGHSGGSGGHQGGGGGGHRSGHGHSRGGAQKEGHGIFTRPMDHSYRNGGQNVGNQRGGRGGGIGGGYIQPDPEPIRKLDENAAPRIFAFIDDLFFLAKIQETARKLNVKVEFVKTDKDILERLKTNGDEKPSLIIFDLNNANAKPLTTIPKLKKELKKGTAIIGFLSHLQADLKMKAQEAGCDMVLPRSSFSQNLPSLLRRHGANEEDQ